MADSMGELYKEAQCNNSQTNSDDNESGLDDHMTRLVEAWFLWLIGFWLDLFQVAQIMKEIVHRLVPPGLITANGPHHYRSQFRRDLWIREEDRGRVLGDALVHNSKNILSLKRRTTTEHFIQHYTNCVNISVCGTALAFELFW